MKQQQAIWRRIFRAIREVRAELIRLAEQIKDNCKPSGNNPRVRFDFTVGLVRNKKGQNSMPIEIKITNEQEVDVTVSPKTDTGKPAKIDGSPAWVQLSGNGSIRVSEDGLTATLVSADDPGDSEFIVKADADIGEGTEEISDIVKLSVVGATAKNLGLTAGTPRAKATV